MRRLRDWLELLFGVDEPVLTDNMRGEAAEVAAVEVERFAALLLDELGHDPDLLAVGDAVQGALSRFELDEGRLG